MRQFLFLTSSPRPNGNSILLARQAARPLPAANTQWLNLASPSLPDFTDPRPVLCPAPTGRLAKVLNATLHASDLVIAAPTPAMLELNFAPTALLAPGVPKPDDNTDVVWENHALAADGTMGDRITTEYNTPKVYIEPGRYKLLIKLGEVQVETDLMLTADSLAAPEVIMNAARVILHAKAATDQPVSDAAAVNVTAAGGIDTTACGTSRFYLPAGEAVLTASLGRALVTETLTLAPGDLVERDVVIGSGLPAVDGYSIASMVMDSTQHAVAILQAKKALDGSQKSIDTSYGPAQDFNLSPGDYIARVSQVAATVEVPFTVKVGERVDIKVALNADVLGVTATGANLIELFAAKPDLNGNRKSLTFDCAETTSKTMPEGDYLIEVTRGEVLTEATASVKRSERTETTVPQDENPAATA